MKNLFKSTSRQILKKRLTISYSDQRLKYPSELLLISENIFQTISILLSFTEPGCSRSPKRTNEELDGNQKISLDGRCIVLQRRNTEWHKSTVAKFSCDFFSELSCEGSSKLFEDKGDYKFDFVPKSTRCYQCIDLMDICEINWLCLISIISLIV